MGNLVAHIRRISLLLLFSVLQLLLNAQFYSGAQQDFGKNRVQYQDFTWQYYRWDALETYFYAGGKDVAQFVAHSAHYHLKDLQKQFDYNLADRLQFIVYSSLTDFRQSNIGITGDEENNIGGVTRIVGTKVFVYYEGDHAQLDQQVRMGIARVLLEQLMYGGNWKDVIKNSTLLNLPNWFQEGVISFASRDMDASLNSAIRDAIVTGKFEKLNRLEGDDATIAGHAIWNYVSEVYGPAVIPNILYMTRISRNAESGFLYVLGVSLSKLLEESNGFYKLKAEEEDKFKKDPSGKPLAIKTRKTRAYSQFRVDPYGRYAAFVSNELGQYKVWLYEIQKQKTKKLLKGEHKLARIVDRSYPLLAWHPSGKALSYVTERKGEVFLTTYTIDDGKRSTRPVFMLEKVLDMTYSQDGSRLVFSGVKNGQTDLYVFYILGGRTEQLTNDQYDDLEPRFVQNDQGIIFTSNRTDDTLRLEKGIDYVKSKKDVFIYDFAGSSNVLKRVTNTPDINEISPAQYDSVSYTYLTDEAGVWDRSVAQFDSTISHVDTTVHYRNFVVSRKVTDLRRGIIEQDVHSKEKRIAQLLFIDGKYRFFTDEIGDLAMSVDQDIPEGAAPNDPDRTYPLPSGSASMVKVDPAEKPDSGDDEVDIQNYEFLSEQKKEPVMLNPEVVVIDPLAELERDDAASGDRLRDSRVDFPEQRIYSLNFATDEVRTQIDNSFSSEFYQDLFGAENLNPGLSAETKFGISDLFEDYRIVGGIRWALDLNNSDYSLSYENKRDRMDKKLTLLVQNNKLFSDFFVLKFLTYQARYQLKWPFSEVAGIRGTMMYRFDRAVQLSTDLTSLATPNFNDHNVGVKVEYVFDNTLKKGLNLYNGWRFKFFGEYYQHPTEKNSDITVVGMDVRHAQKIHRDIIWVNRLAGSSSLGSRNILFYLGGVDNWLFPKVDGSIPVDISQNYWFQTMATPMRGFFNNARNGTSFGVFNSEFRVPIFKYLLNKPIKSDLVHNFQVVAFGDVGTAWTGLDPYSEDNSFNTTTIPLNPLTISIRNQREPIIAGYGFGLRTRLLGYFVRADWAWGVDDGTRLPGEFYFSLSLDI